MKIFAVKERRPAPAIVRRRPYVHAPLGLTQRAQQARIGRILRATGAQAKLTIGQPNDRYEQEADRVADQVMRMSDANVAQRVESGTVQPMRIQRMCPECEEGLAQRQPEEEEEELQAKEQPGRTPKITPSIESHIYSMKSGGQPLDSATRSFFEPRFGRDFSDVRLHTDSAAADIARSIHARAFTLGNHVMMSSGEYQPNSQAGKRLLGHELTHVVQQKDMQANNKGETIRRRRLPTEVDLNKLVDSGSYDLPVHRDGLARLISLAMAEMKPKQKRALRRAAWKASGMSLRSYYLLPVWKRHLFMVKAIYQIDKYKKFRLGSPGQTLGSARPRTKVKILHDKARSYMSAIFSGSTYDNSIGQVFGNNNVIIRDVKDRFKDAYTALGRLYRNDKILADRSGFMSETGLGGVTTSSEMLLKPEMIDNPTATLSIITAIHESLHAGNYGTIVDIGGYNEGQIRFRETSASRKRKNAAHYTVIAWRILAPNDTRAHLSGTGIFTPKSRSITRRTSTRSAERIALIEGSKKAGDILKDAVSTAMDLHDLFRKVYNNPRTWVQRYSISSSTIIKFSNTLPYWSKVENLTLHKRTNISHLASDSSRKPVSTVDLALSEGVIRRLNMTRNYIWDDPRKTKKFLERFAASRERKWARKHTLRTRDLIIRRIVLNNVRNITARYKGSYRRDIAAIKLLAKAKGYSRILVVRSPSSFRYP